MSATPAHSQERLSGDMLFLIMQLLTLPTNAHCSEAVDVHTSMHRLDLHACTYMHVLSACEHFYNRHRIQMFVNEFRYVDVAFIVANHAAGCMSVGLPATEVPQSTMGCAAGNGTDQIYFLAPH